MRSITFRYSTLVLAFSLAVGSAAQDRNMIPNPGLESATPLNWKGASAGVSRVDTKPRSGTSCLRIHDASDSHGQGNSPHITVQPGQYYAEGWVRVNPDSKGLITVDVQFFDRKGAYLTSQWMGVSNSTEWTLIRGRVTVPDGASNASLRILPTGQARGVTDDVGPLQGGCFGDDFYFSTLNDAIQDDRARADEYPIFTLDDPTNYNDPAPMRPHIYVTAQKVKGLLSVDELRESIKSGHRRSLWEAVKKRADADLITPPIVPESANYIACNDTAQRILRDSLVFLVTEDVRYKNAALEQIDVTFDITKWPEHWRDDPGQPKNLPAGLRVGQLCAGIGIAYDWLYTGLTTEERRRIVAGLDRQGIQPFIQTVKQGNWQVAVLDNFMPAIVGGVGLAGMSLAEDHPESGFLVKTARQRMKIYLSVFGAEGEWNESVGYSGSVRDSVDFYLALHYWTATRPNVATDNTLTGHPFSQFCQWKMYMTMPHGRDAKFGNCSPQQKVTLPYVPAVASATRNGVLQWFYLNHLFEPEQTFNTRDYVTELLTFDPTLQPLDPEGRMRHGHAFPSNTMCVSSRTDWSPLTTPLVVYGKGGAAYEIHGHHDVGQVCIDGHGEGLIIDQVGYDGGYDGGFHDVYSALGHNVLTFNRKDMIRDQPRSRVCFNQPEVRNWPALRSKWIAQEFDDRKGGYWILDTTDVYEDVKKVRRTVVHLNPGVAVVMDTATLKQPGDISLRWHTVTETEPNANGTFLVRGKNRSRLSSKVTRIDDGNFAIARGEHGESHGSYVETVLSGTRCTILSLFCVIGENDKLSEWHGSDGTWSIQAPGGTVEVNVSDQALSVHNRDADYGWIIQRH